MILGSEREILTLLIDGGCFCETKVKSGWITAENLSYAVEKVCFRQEVPFKWIRMRLSRWILTGILLPSSPRPLDHLSQT